MRPLIFGCWCGGTALAVVAVWLGYPLWTLVLLFPLGLSLWATFARYCEWWGPMLRSFGSRYREVLLTFDAAPDPDEMPIVLVLLERYRARGLFFVDAERAKRHPERVKEIVQKGHGIGLSLPLERRAGVWHRLPKTLGTEVAEHVAWLKEQLPDYPLQWWMDVGSRSPWFHHVLEQHGLEAISCSADDGGWLMRDMEKTLLRMRSAVGKGGVLRFHHQQRDTRGHSCMPEVLEEMLLWLRGQGYTMGE
jgi:peptidoglycan/xylan/chitin deacetylase (PgdA/CDA1 family)